MSNNSFLNRKFTYINVGAYKYLILINVIIMFFISKGSTSLFYYGSVIPSFVLKNFQVYRIFTYMFLHANWNHLFSNMIGLFFFGRALENALGTKEFLLYYILCGLFTGLASSILYLIIGQEVILIGASGAIFAVLLAFAVLYPDAKILLFFFIPIRAPYLVLIYGIFEIVSQITGIGGNISHLAHLFGLLLGWVYLVVRIKANPVKIWKRNGLF